MRDTTSVDLAMRVVAALAVLFLALPVLMIFPLSIDPREMIGFPPKGFTLRWYEEFVSSPEWIASTMLSLRVAAGASLVATVLGTLAGIALVRGSFPLKKLVGLVLVSPLLLPLVVIAIAIYGTYASLGLIGSALGLALAHSVLAMPFVVINVASAMSAVPRTYEEAAGSLGASPSVVLFTVTIPMVWRGIAAGAVFAFVISFDEVVIALFLGGTTSITLPKRMFDGIFFDLSPVLAAISACLVLFNVALALLGLWLSSSLKRA